LGAKSSYLYKNGLYLLKRGGINEEELVLDLSNSLVPPRPKPTPPGYLLDVVYPPYEIGFVTSGIMSHGSFPMNSVADDFHTLHEGLAQTRFAILQLCDLLVAKVESDHRSAAATRLQAAAPGFLARRPVRQVAAATRLQAVACRLQAAAHGFLVRRQARQVAALVWLQAAVRRSLAQRLALLRVEQHEAHVVARPSAGLADPPLQFTS
jgi:hypothetical protein